MALESKWLGLPLVFFRGGLFCELRGRNHLGQLGDGTNSQRNSPVLVAGLASPASAIAAGFGHTCVLLTTGKDAKRCALVE